MNTEHKSLSELGEDYLRQAEETEKRMRQLKEKLPSLSGAELLRANRDITQMWNIVAELRHTGEYLKDYYKGEK